MWQTPGMGSRSDEGNSVLFTEGNMGPWSRSPAMKRIISFISRCNQFCIEGHTPIKYPIVDPFLLRMVDLLNKIDQLVEEEPLMEEGGQRFGNRAFRNLEEKIQLVLSETPLFRPESCGLHEDNIVGENLLHQQWKEDASVYLLNSFGSYERIDYGTGHELNFILCLMWIEKLLVSFRIRMIPSILKIKGHDVPEDNIEDLTQLPSYMLSPDHTVSCISDEQLDEWSSQHLTQMDTTYTVVLPPSARGQAPLPSLRPPTKESFIPDTIPPVSQFVQFKLIKELDNQLITLFSSHYMPLARKIQQKFRLEPAGSHGTNSLDDYQFGPFLWGSGQMVSVDVGSPSIMADVNEARRLKGTYMLFDALHFIHESKKGPFFEHSITLWNISAVEEWTKVNKGLLKMYVDNVLMKFPVVQHIRLDKHFLSFE